MQARQQSDKSLQTCFDDCKREFERVLKEAHVCRPAQCHGWQDSKHTLDGQSRASAGLSTVIFEYFWWFIDTQGLFTISTGAWFFSWTGWSFWCERLEERHALVFFLTTHGVGWGGAVFTFLQLAHAGDAHAMNATLLMGWCGVGLCSGSFNLHTLVMHTPWMLRYSWGGVGGAVFTFLQLAHAGDAHAMNATLLMGWCGVRLCSRSFNLHTLMHTPWMLRYSWGGVGWGCVHVPSTCTRWWCTRHECYATHGVVWGGAVFMFLQLAHAGDAHAMNATVLMGWCGVAVFMFLQLAHAGHGVGVGVGVGGVMLLTFNWSRTPTWCYAQLLHLHKRCHVGVERFWGMPLGGFGRLLTVNMIGCNRPRSAGLLWRFHAWLHWLGCQLVWRKYRVHIYIYIYIYKFANVHIRLCMYIHIFPNMHI